MAEIKGKLLTLCGMLAGSSPKSVKQIDEYLEGETGYTHLEIDPEEFYPAGYWDKLMKIYAGSSDDEEKAIISLGKRIYPTLKRTMGFPDNLKTPKDWIKFEAEGYLANHQGDDVEPREIVDESENSVSMYAPAPGYDERLYIGVWLGILEMIGVTTGKVDKVKDHTYKISW